MFGKEQQFTSISEAVVDAAEPGAYSYGGELERLSAENSKLKELISRLVECLYGEQKPKHEAVKYILGYGYEVEE